MVSVGKRDVIFFDGRIIDILSAVILNRSTCRNNTGEALIGNDTILCEINDRLIHRHLVVVVVCKAAMRCKLRICPGHVPIKLGVGIGLARIYVIDEILQIAKRGGHAAQGTSLLHGDDIPIAQGKRVFQRSLPCGIGGPIGVTRCVDLEAFIIGTRLGTAPVTVNGATANVELANDDFLNAQLLCKNGQIF